MLNMSSKATTESPLQTVSISSCRQLEQISNSIKTPLHKIASITDKGRNKEENQDNVLALCGHTIMGSILLLAVADGVGGLECGNEASRIAIDGLRNWWNISLKSILYRDADNVQYLINESLSATLNKTNLEILEQGVKNSRKMATTLSAIFILDDWYCIKHIGDSRVYLITKDLIQLTKDHNLLNQYLETFSMDEIKCSIKALDNVLTRCMGIKPELELFEKTGSLKDIEGVLLCTDGLYKLLSSIEIDRGIRGWRGSTEDMQMGLKLLIRKVRKRGEKDDVSVVLMAMKRNTRKSLLRLLKNLTGRERLC